MHAFYLHGAKDPRPAAQFVTGVCLPVDGGASIGF